MLVAGVDMEEDAGERSEDPVCSELTEEGEEAEREEVC